jgi:methionyl-tRNA formyltransferase
MKSVLLLGMGGTALTALDSLASRFRVVGVVRPGPKGADHDDDVALRARELEIPMLTDMSISGIEYAISVTRPDCVVCSSYNIILPVRILDKCKFVNVHYAPLPRYRGQTHVNWAIINGEREAGLSIHVMAPIVDAGNILFQKRIGIGPHETAMQVVTNLNEIQRMVLGDTVARYLEGYEGKPQDDSQATYACRRIPSDGEIRWRDTTERIYALVRALSPPYPGAYTYLNMRRIVLLRAAPVVNAPFYVGRIAGRVVARSRDKGFVDVLTGDGVLRIHEVAVEQGVTIPAANVITSTSQTLGLRVADLLARLEELEKLLRAHASEWLPRGEAQVLMFPAWNPRDIYFV